MQTETRDKSQLLHQIGDAGYQLAALMDSVKDDKVNTVPFEGSWTAAQVLNHVTKSILRMAKAMKEEGPPAGRDAAERIEQLKGIFLDFSRKLKAPEFIVPDSRIYDKQEVMLDLKQSFDQFKQNAEQANGDELVEGLPFGSVTKLELMHFVWYHTQRHLHQMQKICKALEEVD